MKKIIRMRDRMGNEYEIDTGSPQGDAQASAALARLNAHFYQEWLPWLQPNCKKKKGKRGRPTSTSVAIEKIKARINPEDKLSDKSVAEYQAQLKGYITPLSFAHR